MGGGEEFCFCCVFGEGFDLGDEFGGGVGEGDLGLVLEGDELFERALLEEFSLMDDADGVADFLHLFEEVGAEKDGDAVGFEAQDEVADLAGAKGVDAGSGFVEDEEAGRLNERLREANALKHSLGIAA